MKLGDKRVNNRLIDLADMLVASEGDSWPNKFAQPADYHAFQDLVNRPEATHESVRVPHTRQTRQRMAEANQVVLIIHDTTELDYSGRNTLHLGPIGNGGGRGWECHNSLAVDPNTRAVIGLANQILHRRVEKAVTEKETKAARRDRTSRESRLWWQGITACGVAPSGSVWIHVCDRGADCFELLQQLTDTKRSFVIRSKSNRALIVDDEKLQTEKKAKAKLHEVLRAMPAQVCWRGVARTDKGKSRPVKLQACWAEFTLRPPHAKSGEYRKEGVRVGAIRVWEVDPPEGEKKGVEWILVTDQKITDALSVRQLVEYYERRPIIEEYHKAFKTGCGVEKLQQRTGAALEAAIGITAILALGLLMLRDVARDETRQSEPAATLVGECSVCVLSVWRLGVAKVDWTVREFVKALGRLGGHMNRPSDGIPGWQTLWRGLRKLRQMIAYHQKAIATYGSS